MTRFFVICIYCGSSCWIRGNGATCTTCGTYAHRKYGGDRWTVYVPTRFVPYCSTGEGDGLKWMTIGVTWCEPNPDRVRALIGDEQYEQWFQSGVPDITAIPDDQVEDVVAAWADTRQIGSRSLK